MENVNDRQITVPMAIINSEPRRENGFSQINDNNNCVPQNCAFQNLSYREPIDLQFRDITYTANLGFRKGEPFQVVFLSPSNAYTRNHAPTTQVCIHKKKPSRVNKRSASATIRLDSGIDSADSQAKTKKVHVINANCAFSFANVCRHKGNSASNKWKIPGRTVDGNHGPIWCRQVHTVGRSVWLPNNRRRWVRIHERPHSESGLIPQGVMLHNARGSDTNVADRLGEYVHCCRVQAGRPDGGQ